MFISLLVASDVQSSAAGEESTASSTLQTANAQVVEEQTVTPRVYDPVGIVEHYSEEYGVDSTLAKAIIKCESGIYGTSVDVIEDYQRTIPNQQGLSSASGYGQFLDGTWENTMVRMGYPVDTDKHHPIVSIEALVWLLSQDGTRHWLESKSCWIRYTS